MSCSYGRGLCLRKSFPKCQKLWKKFSRSPKVLVDGDGDLKNNLMRWSQRGLRQKTKNQNQNQNQWCICHRFDFHSASKRFCQRKIIFHILWRTKVYGGRQKYRQPPKQKPQSKKYWWLSKSPQQIARWQDALWTQAMKVQKVRKFKIQKSWKIQSVMSSATLWHGRGEKSEYAKSDI